MDCQRDLFTLDPTDAYLNGASRSPQLRAVAAAARHALHWRETNSGMPIPEFFAPVERVRAEFSRLVGAGDPERIALIPAASYGLATVARNLPLATGQNIVVAAEQFPSNYYVWERRCREAGAELRVVARPAPGEGRSWSHRVEAAVDERTAAVAIAQVHWADGTPFDLVALRAATDRAGAWLVVDGTQSVGALPLDVAALRPDALIVAGYKWLMGPYGGGYAYYGPRMDGGTPLEENWINRAGSEDFRRLVDYRDDYRPKAGRYCVGEHSNFLMVPMQEAALQQVNAWGPANVRDYCAGLWAGVADRVAELNLLGSRGPAPHLVGLRLPDGLDATKLTAFLTRHRITVSYRGDSLRVSPNVYNRGDELALLLDGIEAAMPNSHLSYAPN